MLRKPAASSVNSGTVLLDEKRPRRSRRSSPHKAERPLYTVLSVSGDQEDHETVRRMVDCRWSLRQSSSIAAAWTELAENRFAILLCDHDSFPGAWKDLRADVALDATPPCVVVTSRLADARLWAEALNLGAWDVLAKPLDHEEVLRVLGTALTRWTGEAADLPLLTAASA